MKKLLIIGAGGHGRCCFDIAKRMNLYDTIHFLDDNSNDNYVVGKINDLSKYKNDHDEVFIAIGNNQMRYQLTKKCKEMNLTVTALIDPMSFISPESIIEEGTVIFPFASVESKAVVKEGSIISSNVIIHHDTVIDKFSLIYGHCVIRPKTHIQSFETIGSSMVIDRKNIIEERG
ncbi:hypothetical protein B5E92_12340 [Erysipelatoclostridium sp. An15]|uniref:PglD-related sugar-binding protein n=1 Tax=Erysipelatoclostridium sp. An15 TaxID=1965566 RepID=UPI000B39B9D8|nr:hypothetical protein [Erysipelatoclostridium sp. An15]OUQ05198.1 hypothetical protein B5E92_12340 [Erysipelatoclostridium sp. An15]